MNIYQAIPKIASEVGAIGKDRSNDQQHYKFRGIDDVYNALNGLLSKYGVFTVPKVLESAREERPSKSGGVLIWTFLKMEYTFFADDGSNVVAIVTGEGMDSGDKSANKAMAVAHKYALLQTFSIPTEDPKDPENDSPEPAPRMAWSSPRAPIHADEIPPPPPEEVRAVADEQFGPRPDGLPYENEILPFGKKSKGKMFKDIPASDLESARKWILDKNVEKYYDLAKHIQDYLNASGLPF